MAGTITQTLSNTVPDPPHIPRRGLPRDRLYAHTGRLPLLAGGNADVDIEMLESATFAVLINHDDQRREYAYTAGAEKSLARAAELGWAVVNISSDWSTVF